MKWILSFRRNVATEKSIWEVVIKGMCHFEMRSAVTIEKSVRGFVFNNSFEISHAPFSRFEMTTKRVTSFQRSVATEKSIGKTCHFEMRNAVTIEKSNGGFVFDGFEISHIPFGQFEMTLEVDSVISKKRSD